MDAGKSRSAEVKDVTEIIDNGGHTNSPQRESQWILYFDESSGYNYWYNASTGESQWADEDAQNHEADYEESLVTSLKSPDLTTDHATKLPDGARECKQSSLMRLMYLQ